MNSYQQLLVAAVVETEDESFDQKLCSKGVEVRKVAAGETRPRRSACVQEKQKVSNFDH